MSHRAESASGSNKAMKAYLFTCTACGQEIEVNETMREAIVANGCPVCASTVSDDEFDE